jgi:hypothetical protein
MAAQQRLSELRAEIAVAEHEVQAVCSAGVAPASLHAPSPPLEEAAAEWAGGLGPPVTESRPDAAFTGSGGRRRQTSGTAAQSPTQTATQTVRNNCSPPPGMEAKGLYLSKGWARSLRMTSSRTKHLRLVEPRFTSGTVVATSF